MSFFNHRLREVQGRKRSILCVGLDPDPRRFPRRYLKAPDPVFAFNRDVIEATKDLVCAYKPQIAFYEALGLDGLYSLRRTIRHIRLSGAGALVILDGKRGDVPHTADAYARAMFEEWQADAVTVNPYLGPETIEPFLARPDRGVFVLCVTSNPDAATWQEPVYRQIAGWAGERACSGNVGLVVGATHPRQLAEIRDLAPGIPLLVPGIGAQGGDIDACLAAGVRRPEDLILVNSSRSILYAGETMEHVHAAAQSLHERLLPRSDQHTNHAEHS